MFRNGFEGRRKASLNGHFPFARSVPWFPNLQGKRPSFLEPRPVPPLLVRGKGTYTAMLEPINPVSTTQSIECVALARTHDRSGTETLQQLDWRFV